MLARMDKKTRLFDRIQQLTGTRPSSPYSDADESPAELGRLSFTWSGPGIGGGTDSIPPSDLLRQDNKELVQFTVGDGDPILDGDPEEGFDYYLFDPGDANRANRRDLVLWRDDALYAYDAALTIGAKMQLTRDGYMDALLDHAGIHGWAMLFTSPGDLTRGFMQGALEDFAPQIRERLLAMRDVLVRDFAYAPTAYAAHWERWTAH